MESQAATSYETYVEAFDFWVEANLYPPRPASPSTFGTSPNARSANTNSNVALASNT